MRRRMDETMSDGQRTPGEIALFYDISVFPSLARLLARRTLGAGQSLRKVSANLEVVP
jgi:hypothetical protein